MSSARNAIGVKVIFFRNLGNRSRQWQTVKSIVRRFIRRRAKGNWMSWSESRDSIFDYNWFPRFVSRVPLNLPPLLFVFTSEKSFTNIKRYSSISTYYIPWDLHGFPIKEQFFTLFIMLYIVLVILFYQLYIIITLIYSTIYHRIIYIFHNYIIFHSHCIIVFILYI